MEIAAYGWEHRGWVGPFYPEDMPEQWRLDFYCNEFHALVVPAAKWSAGGAAPLEMLARGMGDDTRLYLELAPATEPGRAREAAAVLGEHLAGFVTRRSEGPAPAELGRPVGVWGGPADGEPVPGVCRCWPAEEGIPRCSGGGLATVWVGPAPPPPMVLRRTIEALADRGREGDSLVVVAGEPPSLQLMRDARTMAELLGV